MPDTQPLNLLPKNEPSRKKTKTIFNIFFIVFFIVLFILILVGRFIQDSLTTPTLKPVIYLYPEQTQTVQIQLEYKGQLIADFPSYDYAIQGWKVTAQPDGTITDHSDGKTYSYLFWEGIPDKKINWDLTTGFVVKGQDTKLFLQNILPEIGLTPKEYNEFIVYWYPLMKDNTYNLIHFADKQYIDLAQLTITPEPKSLLRVFMVYKALEEPINIQPQNIHPFKREGFTVVEWGGSEIK